MIAAGTEFHDIEVKPDGAISEMVRGRGRSTAVYLILGNPKEETRQGLNNVFFWRGLRDPVIAIQICSEIKEAVMWKDLPVMMETTEETLILGS